MPARKKTLKKAPLKKAPIKKRVPIKNKTEEYVSHTTNTDNKHHILNNNIRIIQPPQARSAARRQSRPATKAPALQPILVSNYHTHNHADIPQQQYNPLAFIQQHQPLPEVYKPAPTVSGREPR